MKFWEWIKSRVRWLLNRPVGYSYNADRAICDEYGRVSSWPATPIYDYGLIEFADPHTVVAAYDDAGNFTHWARVNKDEQSTLLRLE